MIDESPPAPETFSHKLATALFGNKAHAIVENQIKALSAFKMNKGDIDLQITKQPAYEIPPEKMAHLMIGLFQCDSKIAKKIDHLKNDDGQTIVSREGGVYDGKEIETLNIWNSKTGNFEEYIALHNERDPESGFQGAALYDPRENTVALCFGGTDFSNPKDMFRSGGQMMGGLVDDRMTRAVPFTELAMNKFKEIFPEDFATANVDLMMHSVGPRCGPLAEYCLNARYGKTARSKSIVEPVGAKSAYDLVTTMIAKSENKSEPVVYKELTHNTKTYRALQGSFIDWFPTVSENVGDVVVRKDVQGKGPIAPHMGATWINKFNEESRYATVKNFGSAQNGKAVFKQESKI